MRKVKKVLVLVEKFFLLKKRVLGGEILELLNRTFLRHAPRDAARTLRLGGVRLNLPEFRWLIPFYSNPLKQCSLVI